LIRRLTRPCRNPRTQGLQPDREPAGSGAADAGTSRACSTAKQSCPLRQIAVTAAVAAHGSSSESGTHLLSSNHRQHADGEGPLRHVQKLKPFTRVERSRISRRVTMRGDADHIRGSIPRPLAAKDSSNILASAAFPFKRGKDRGTRGSRVCFCSRERDQRPRVRRKVPSVMTMTLMTTAAAAAVAAAAAAAAASTPYTNREREREREKHHGWCVANE